eukprot:scaffold5036_cov120-Cyclotella_meneghiniana.AAC.1
MAPGERTIGAVTDSNDENDVTEESREQALEEIRQLNEDDANRVLRPNDVSDDMDEFEYHTTDPDEFDGPDENNQATCQRQRRANDFDAEARQVVAEINVIGFNKLALMDLRTKGEQLVAKDNLKVTREGTKRRLNRKMALSKAIHKKVAAMNAASQ